MSGLHDLGETSFWHTSVASALVYVPAMLLFGAFNGFPAIRGQWTMAHEGVVNMFVLGIAFAVWAGLTFKAYSETIDEAGGVDANATRLKRRGYFLSLVAFVLIAVPAFGMQLTVLNFG